jgi:heavy metal sensor kinase
LNPAMRKTIHARLTLWYIVLLALILIGFSAALYFTLARALYQQADDSLVRNAHDLTEGLRIKNGQFDYPGGENDISDLDAVRAQGYLIRILDVDGKVLNTNPTYAPLPVVPESIAMARRGLPQVQTVSVDGEAYRLYTAPVENDGQPAGALQIAEVLGAVAVTLRELMFALAVIVPLTLALATFGGMWFARRALVPIDQITRTAQRISAQDLSQRLNLNLPNDEVGRLAHTFDAMLARLDDAFRREREFTANAAHELRTPLTVMRGEIDVVLQRPRERTEYERVLSELGADVEQLSRITEDLLMLARADAHQIAITCEELNAAQLLQAVADELRPLAEAQQIALDVHADPALRFWGDEQKMLRVLFNLVDNALKFSAPDTRVLLTATPKGDAVSLCVSDQGAGIASDALPHIFDRFYRGTNGDASGAGLGLAIARALVQAQAGHISGESALGQGTTITVELPMRNF